MPCTHQPTLKSPLIVSFLKFQSGTGRVVMWNLGISNSYTLEVCRLLYYSVVKLGLTV